MEILNAILAKAIKELDCLIFFQRSYYFNCKVVYSYRLLRYFNNPYL